MAVNSAATATSLLVCLSSDISAALLLWPPSAGLTPRFSPALASQVLAIPDRQEAKDV